MKLEAIAAHEGQFQIKTVTFEKEFHSLESAWCRLLEQSSNSNFYMSFEYISTWWKCLGIGKQLFIIVIRKGDRIVGIAPLMKEKKTTPYIPLSYEEIRFISTIAEPNSAKSFSGTLDILIDPEFESARVAFVRFLVSEMDNYHVLRLHPFPEDSPTLNAFEDVKKKLNIRIYKKKVFDNACLKIEQDWKTYFQTRSKNLKKKIRRFNKKLSECGKISLVQYQQPEEMDEAIKNIELVESKSWKAEDGIPINDNRYNNFFFDLLKSISPKGWSRIGILKSNDTPIAYEYNVNYFGFVKQLKASFDKSYSQFSPGSLLITDGLKYFFQDEVKEIDMLWGNLSYKKKWMDKLRAHYEIIFFQPDFYTRLITSIYRSAHVWEKFRSRFRK